MSFVPQRARMHEAYTEPLVLFLFVQSFRPSTIAGGWAWSIHLSVTFPPHQIKKYYIWLIRIGQWISYQKAGPVRERDGLRFDSCVVFCLYSWRSKSPEPICDFRLAFRFYLP